MIKKTLVFGLKVVGVIIAIKLILVAIGLVSIAVLV